MQPVRRIVAHLWLAHGAVLAGQSLILVGQSLLMKPLFFGLLASSALGLAFGASAIAGAALELRSHLRGAALLKGVAIVELLYAIAYMVFGGVHDRSATYLVAVSALSLLSIVTLAVPGRNSGQPSSSSVFRRPRT
jgi:hypothetical protein